MADIKQSKEALSKVKKSFFRLEILPEYRVSGDWEKFQKFKKGESYIGQEEKEWFKTLENATAKGISIKRVRIISNRLSDYLNYEIDFWKNSCKYGEEILFLPERKYNEIKAKLKIEPEDFWMFDEETIFIFHYNAKGEFLKEEKILESPQFQNYQRLKEELLKSAIPMNESV